MRSRFSSYVNMSLVYSCWDGLFWILIVFSFRHLYGYVCFLHAFTQLQWQSLVDGCEFIFSTRIQVCHHGLALSSFVFWVLPLISKCVRKPLALIFFFHLIHSAFLSCFFFCSTILFGNWFVSFASGCLCALFTKLLFSKVLFCSYFLTLSPGTFLNLHSFANIFYLSLPVVANLVCFFFLFFFLTFSCRWVLDFWPHKIATIALKNWFEP